MSHIAYPSDEEFGTALAAAAYAVTLLAEEGSLNQRQPSEELTRSPTKTTSKKEDGIKKRSGTIRISRWLSGKDAREDWRPAGGKSRKKSTTLEERMREDIADEKMPEEATGTSTPTVRKTTFSDTYLNDTGILADRRTKNKPIGRAPTMKKMPTFSDEYLNDTGNKRPEGEQDMREDIADRKMAEGAMGTTPTVKKTPTFSDKYLNDTDIDDSRRPEKPKGTAPTMKKMPTSIEKYLNDAGSKRSEGEHDMREGIADRKMTEKAMGATSTVKKTPTFSDKYLNDAGSERIEGGKDMGAGQTEGSWYQNNIKPQKQETEADSWEREEMAKIRKRHEKLNFKILEWENEKKMKARHRKERKERELERRRARLLQEYRNEILTIDKVAGGARAASDERRRKDELKAKETAKIIRSAGKVPHTWFCI